MTEQKTFLVAILNWGLGHATRCIPVINKLLQLNQKVIIASDGLSLQLLKQEFTDVLFIELPAYNIKYPKFGQMFFALLWQTPRLLKTIKASNQLVQKLVVKYKIDYIISDNRYGCHNKLAYSVFLTHQVNIPLPKAYKWFRKAVDRQNAGYINQYNELWIPDFEGHLLSGELSLLNKSIRVPAYCIGALSRLKVKEVNQRNFVLAILSGPEPHRSIFEQKIINQAQFFKGDLILIRGTRKPLKEVLPGNLKIIDLAESNTINELLLQAKHIICRAGYSSIMDLMQLNRTAFLVPTPGQTEQEILADKLSSKKYFITSVQTLFNLNKAVVALETFKLENNSAVANDSFAGDDELLSLHLNRLLQINFIP